MARITLLLTICLIINSSLIVSAEEGGLTPDQLESRLSLIKNPFTSQLPAKKKEKKIVKEKPVKTETLKTPRTAKSSTIERTSSKSKVPEVKEEPEEVIPPLPNITISGVIWDTDRPQAIINGHIINIGDAILQIEVTDIRKTEIDGLFHGKPVTIKTQRSPI